jgi:uncharacterized repeat protein (TIGR03803 family)
MKTLTAFAVTLAAAALFAGCGTYGAVPQTSAIAGARTGERALPASSYQVLTKFRSYVEGAYPAARLLDVKGTLYGTTGGGLFSGKGIAYSVSTTGVKKILHKFGHGSDGAGPTGGALINVNGTLYGTTGGGGLYGRGTVYSMSTTGTEKVLHSFKYDSNGAGPAGGLVDVNGTLYGTTGYGGSGCGEAGCGTVYSISTTGVYSVIYRFKGGSQGAYSPDSGLIAVNGTLYGTTYLGGNTGCYYDNGCGTVFAVTTSGAETLLYRFTGGSDGAYPQGDLIDANGILYGVTMIGGGASNQGTVYSLSTTGSEKVLHRFGRASDGGSPQAGLVDVNGTLYGTTWSGGSSNWGTIYRIGATGSEKVLYSFTGGSDGANPSAAFLNVNGTLYGTTVYGGGGSGCKFGCGTIFALSGS